MVRNCFLFSIFQEYSVQITFRQKWNDDRLSYAHRLSHGDMGSKCHRIFRKQLLFSGARRLL